MAIVELRSQFDHCDLPGEAEKPDEGEDQRHSVKLVMNEFVVLIDLKYKCVVYIVPAEHLNCKAC